MGYIPVLAFHVDDTLSEVGADMAFVLIIAFNALIGWRYGLMRRALTLGALFLGILGATYTGNQLAAIVKPDHDLWANAWTYIAVIVVVVGFFEVLGALYNDRLRGLIAVTFDRASGLIAGLLVGFFEVAVLFLVILTTNDVQHNVAAMNGQVAGTDPIRNGTLSEIVVPVEAAIENIFAPVLPPHLGSHLAEGTPYAPH